MLLGGLWHGANWTFVVWGGIHGAGLAWKAGDDGRWAIRESGDVKLWSINAWISRIVVFHLVCLAWIFFRAASIHEALTFLSGVRTLAWAPE